MTALQLELAETTTQVLADARAAGHDPHPWTTDALDARTACRRCGAILSVTVRATHVAVHSPAAPCPPK